jgi:hypothetical protein
VYDKRELEIPLNGMASYVLQAGMLIAKDWWKELSSF